MTTVTGCYEDVFASCQLVKCCKTCKLVNILIWNQCYFCNFKLDMRAFKTSPDLAFPIESSNFLVNKIGVKKVAMISLLFILFIYNIHSF